MSTPITIVAAALAAVSFGCGGGSDVRCGTGTVLQNKTCIAEVKCGEGTVARDGACVSTEVIEREKAGELGKQALGDMAAYADAVCACKDIECADTADGKLEEIGRKYANLDPNSLGDELMEKLTGEAMRAAECRGKLMSAGEPSSAIPFVGVAECDALITKYADCDKLPAQARDAFFQGASAWKKLIDENGDDARAALTESCKQATVAADRALKAVGCPEP